MRDLNASTLLAPYLHQFSAVMQCLHFFGAICDKISLEFGANLASNFKIYADTAPSNGAIWDEFSEQISTKA